MHFLSLDVEQIEITLDCLYNRRLDYFFQKVEGLKEGFECRSQQLQHFQSMQRMYLNLLATAVSVNQTTSKILFPMVTFTTPFITVCLFISLYSDVWIHNVAVPVLAVSFTIPTLVLQAIAGKLTAKSEQIHKSLVAVLTHGLHGTRRQPVDKMDGKVSEVEEVSLLPHQQKVILQIMDEVGGEHPPLALYSIEGQKYTMHTFVNYLISLGLNYLLILTFDRLFDLH